MEIAKTIYNQLRTLGQVKVWSWGAHSWEGGKDFLQFKVHGFKYIGRVRITLMPTDVYKIEFIKKGVVVETYHDVYFDTMVDLIDKYVELTDDYENDVNNAVYKF